MPILLLKQQRESTDVTKITDFKEPNKGMLIYKNHCKKPLTVSVPVDVGANPWNNSCQAVEVFPVRIFCIS